MLVIPLIALSASGPKSDAARVQVAGVSMLSELSASSISAAAPPAAAAMSVSAADAAALAALEPAPVAPLAAAAPVFSAPAHTATGAGVGAGAGAPVHFDRTAPAAAVLVPRPAPAAPRAPALQVRQTGQASWYGAARGTCAHPSLAFGTVVHILDTDNGRTATCVVDDRGPYLDGRIIDLAPDVFDELASTSQGVINVQLSW
jgi:rare lipoprotein A